MKCTNKNTNGIYEIVVPYSITISIPIGHYDNVLISVFAPVDVKLREVAFCQI